MEKAIERISEMEKCLNETNEIIASMAYALDKIEESKEDMTALFRYYGSEEWYEDRDRKLPEGMPAGVLSEDLVYDAIIALREEAIRMLEAATDILKNRI
ncbi:MAG: DUF4298 domain-containing protein [Erysipelotrichaceae bacterium]|nr:DUF4298 domain-containing protein [Erysipelotrichaceae bacterium]